MPFRLWAGMILASAAFGYCAEPPDSLEDLVREMIESNPSLRAAQYRLDAALKRPSQAGTLPDPKLSITNLGVGHPFSRLGQSDFAYQGFGVSQEIPFPGKLALAEEEARKEAGIERGMYRAARLDAVGQLKAVYYDWFGTAKTIEITRKNRTLLESFEEIARARYSVGKGLQQDILKAQVEESALAQRLEILEQRKATAENRIRSLLNSNRPLQGPAEVAFEPLRWSLDELLSTLHRNSPRLEAQQASIDARSTGITRARKDYRPDFAFNFQWQKTGAPFPDYYMASAEVKIPIYFWRKQRLAVEEAAARYQQARSDYMASRQDLEFQVKELYLAATTAERLMALLRDALIPQSSLALESGLASYQVGSTDFLTLLNNSMSVLTYEMQYIDELVKHAQARARIESLIGELK